MDVFSLLGVAFALAMDAFAVALSTGAYLVKADARQTFRLSFHFGLFQFLMPVIGWAVGAQAERLLADFDHWIAFVLLAYIAFRMIQSSLADDDGAVKTDVTRGGSLVALSVATSIDALAVGLSLGLMREAIITPSIVIGLVAGGMTLVGLRLGERFSARLGKKMELAGGIVLILIGAKIVLDHILAAG
ncbi:MAG: manganese efflux pump [Ignavibacteriae bacterium]|nr:manganese efflux pump [Ignavibacteriota bacterium]